MFSLKRANKNLQKRARRASELLCDLVGLSPRKELLRALLAGDEEKAILIYTSVSNGKSLEENMYPSLPLLDNNHQTPMHLAAMKGMETLLRMFFSRGGNPNTLNGNNETSLHAVCREPGQDLQKKIIVLLLLDWQENNGALAIANDDDVVGAWGDEVLRVSVNKVDNDGNIACHYAAGAGLEACVLELVRHGCIVSIVNKDQMTCCEMADEGGYCELANAIELALVFQPTDSSTLFLSQGGEFSHEADLPLYLPDAASFTIESLRVWREQQIFIARDALVTHSVPEIEALLDCFDWNINELVFRYMSDPAATLEAARLGGVGDKGVNDNLDAEDVGHEEIGKMICSVCAEPLLSSLSPDELLLLNCCDREQRRVDCGGGHSFCFSCWATFLKMQVVENSLTALTCPAYQCVAALEPSEWAECLLGEDVAQRFFENRCRRVVDSSGDFTWCPSKDCNLIIHVDNESRREAANSKAGSDFDAAIVTADSPVTVTCGHGHSVCLSCQDVGHAPCSCENYALWKNKISKEISETAKLNTNDVATALWVQANTKKCPKCKTPIEKDEGCNHMTCKKCRYDFCWICMQRWENHSNRTGGYFQCNMYATDLESDNDSRGHHDTEEWGENALFSESFSAGSSTKETLRLRKNAAIMDRFIQHYSSFKAHEESVQLEIKMQFDTLSRIADSLQQSARGELLWLRGEEVQHPLIVHPGEGENNPTRLYEMRKGEHEDEVISEILWMKGDVDVAVDPDAEYYPLLFLQKGFRELIKCRQFLKGFFAFSFYMLSDDHIRQCTSSSHHVTSHRILIESRKESIDRARSDLETLAETLSNIVARKRLRASRSEIERATRAARSQRLEFERIVSDFFRSCEKNAIQSTKKAHRQKGKGKNKGRSAGNSRKASFESSSAVSLLENIEYLKALTGGGRGSRGGDNNNRERLSRYGDQGDYFTSQEDFRHDGGRDGHDILHIGNINLSEFDGTACSTFPGSHDEELMRQQELVKGEARGRSQSVSSSSSLSSNASSVNIRRVGSHGTRSYVASVSPDAKLSNSAAVLSEEFNEFSPDHMNQESYDRGSDLSELESNSEELEMNRAILLSLQTPLTRHVSVDMPEPIDSDVQSLVVMGFAKERCLAALRECSNNVEDAVMLLLSRS